MAIHPGLQTPSCCFSTFQLKSKFQDRCCEELLNTCEVRNGHAPFLTRAFRTKRGWVKSIEMIVIFCEFQNPLLRGVVHISTYLNHPLSGARVMEPRFRSQHRFCGALSSSRLFQTLLALRKCFKSKELLWSELFGQVQRAALARAIRSSSKSRLVARHMFKFKEPFWRELFGQHQRAALAPAIRSSSKSRCGASYLVKFKEPLWPELFGQVQQDAKRRFGQSYLVKFKMLWPELSRQVQRAALARAIWSSSKSRFGASYFVKFKELLWRELFGLQRAVLARAILSSSKSCFGASYLVKLKELRWRKLFGQVQRAGGRSPPPRHLRTQHAHHGFKKIHMLCSKLCSALKVRALGGMGAQSPQLHTRHTQGSQHGFQKDS